MKRLFLVAAVFALAACTGDRNEAATDTAAPAAAPAPTLDTVGGFDTARDTLRDTARRTP